MTKPRSPHIALNVEDRDQGAECCNEVFGVEGKYRGSNGTIDLADGFVGIALISRPDMPGSISRNTHARSALRFGLGRPAS
jgi:hypothetical protein